MAQLVMVLFLSKLKDMMKNDYNTHLPILEIGNSYVRLVDGSIAVGYALSLPPKESLSGQQFQQIIEDMHSCLKKLPEHTVLQRMDIFNTHKWHVKSNVLDDLFDDGHLYQYHKYKNVQERTYMRTKSYIFLNFREKKSPSPNQNALFHFFFREKINIYSIERAKKHVLNFEGMFPHQIGIEKLKGDKFAQLLYQYLNLNFRDEYSCSPSIEKTPTYFSVGNKVTSIVSMVSQSDKPKMFTKNEFEVNAEFLYPVYHGLHFDHIVCSALKIESANEIIEQEMLKSERAAAFTRMQGAREEKRRSEELKELEEEVSQKGEGLVSLSFHVVVWAPKVEDTYQRSMQVYSVLANKGLTVTIENYAALPLFFRCAPASAGWLFKGKRMPMKTALAYLNYTSERMGDEKGILLCDRNGAPTYYDPFKTDLNNQNAFVFGPSGSGKSFFNGKLIKERYENGDTVIIIDSGATYKRLIKALGGKFIEYGDDKPLGLNAFSLGASKKLTTDKVDFLAHFLGKIWKGSLTKNPMKEEEKALLAKYLEQYYKQEKGTPMMKKFISFLKEQKIPTTEQKIFDFTSFFIVLDPFVFGIYADHFHPKQYKSQEKNSRLLCFELGALKNNKKLYPLALQLLFEQAYDIIKSRPEDRKFFDVEEGWALLDNYGEEYIESFFRKIRKENGSIRIITQDFSEIAQSKVSGALKNNAATFILLYNNNKQSREEIATWLGLTENEKQMYASLRRRGGKSPWREVFVKEMDKAFVYRIESSLFEYGLLTSKPIERYEISAFEAHMSSEDAVAHWFSKHIMKWY